MNTQRRTFRGRAGPTDGRLPKHNARRRRTQQARAQKPQTNKYTDADEQQQQQQQDECEAQLATSNRTSSEQLDGNELGTIVSESSPPSCETRQQQQQPLMEDSGPSAPPHLVVEQPPRPTQPTVPVVHNKVTAVEPWKAEIRHLRRRCKNVQASIQFGIAGIANPLTYKQNVLNAVENCVNEWRAILNHYHYSHTGTISDNETIDATNPIDPETLKETALAVYVLLQLSLQCGPLAGGKPGYFKRCGGQVARIALEFLDTTVPTNSSNNDHHNQDDAGSSLQFSTTQTDAIAAWRMNASKAADENKPPSKSALKHQQGKSKKKKNKK